VIAIDIPIGLPERGHRQADKAAKSVLGQRQNSVFMTPVRAALEAATHGAATAIARGITGSGISQQAFALRSKILEVEDWLPRAPCPVYEVHPEVSFATMIGHPARATKKSWHGMVERRDAPSHWTESIRR
jgi:predicted RNase H-like nuclease